MPAGACAVVEKKFQPELPTLPANVPPELLAASATITLTFRRWQKPHVRVGGRYRCHPIGVLEVDDVRLVKPKEITADDAARSGFESRDSLLAYLAELGPMFGVSHHAGGRPHQRRPILVYKAFCLLSPPVGHPLVRKLRQDNSVGCTWCAPCGTRCDAMQKMEAWT